MEIHQWLSDTTAAEIMFRDLVTLAPDDSMAKAAGVLLREQISGAPVVDQSRACVGVLSASDVLGASGKVAEERRKVANSDFFNSPLAIPTTVYAERLAQVEDKIAPVAEQSVERFMTKDLVSVHEDAPLATILAQMVDAHIHRVLVLDAEGRLQGIVSTTDVLAALRRADGL